MLQLLVCCCKLIYHLRGSALNGIDVRLQKCRKIKKIIPGLIFSQRPFSWVYFREGRINQGVGLFTFQKSFVHERISHKNYIKFSNKRSISNSHSCFYGRQSGDNYLNRLQKMIRLIAKLKLSPYESPTVKQDSCTCKGFL